MDVDPTNLIDYEPDEEEEDITETGDGEKKLSTEPSEKEEEKEKKEAPKENQKEKREKGTDVPGIMS